MKKNKPPAAGIFDILSAPKRFRLSGSSCERWKNCPGSVELSLKVPPEPPSLAAILGTTAHTLAELSILKNKHPKQWLGTEIKQIAVTQEMVDAVMVYITTLRDDLKKHGLTRDDLKVEQTFQKEGEDTGGTCDAYILTSDQGIIIYDFKFGEVAVEAQNNSQLMFYLALILKFLNLNVSYAELVIVQPRAYHDNGTVRRHRIKAEDIDKWTVELNNAIKRIHDGDATLHAGNHCRWCPAINICPETRKQTLAIAEIDFSPPALTPEKLSLILKKKVYIEGFLRRVSAFAQGEAERGVKIPGFKLVKKKSHRQWGNKQKVIDKFIAEFGAEIYEPENLLSPAKLEKVVGKGKVEKFVIRKEGITLVEEDDPREEIMNFEEFRKG